MRCTAQMVSSPTVPKMPDKPKPLPDRKEAFARRQAQRGIGVFEGVAPEGTGKTNRHGMPQLPVGQREVRNWPVLDLGHHPEVTQTEWRLVVDGLVETELVLDWPALLSFPQITQECDFHCVTTWSRMDMRFVGVRLREVLERAGPTPDAAHILVTAYDVDPSSGEAYTTNVALDEATKDDVLLVHTFDGAPLPREHGGPCRMITPQLYAWKGAKWIRRITLTSDEQLGFWERRGYSSSALPWFNDRYSR